VIAFVGLGNVGEIYRDTKHNAGFWVLDEFANREKISFKPGQGEYLFTEHNRKNMLLVKPTTGMNKSGCAVKDIISHWSLLPEDIYVVFDDVDLPLGTIRIKPKGGDGCHRGLGNIIYQLRTQNFPRVRLGIGTEEDMRPAERYVLQPFRQNHLQGSKIMVSRAADALQTILIKGLNHTMNQFNS